MGHARCTMLLARTAVRRPRSLSSQLRAGLSTAGTATPSTSRKTGT